MKDWSYEEFTAKVQRLIGIDLSEYNERQMKRRIDSFLARNRHQSYNEFYKAMVIDGELKDKFKTFITINVTEFFRNPPQWEKMKSEIIPRLLEYPLPLKIWSCACSTGQEPYSMAMLLSEFVDLKDINILATDIDEVVLEKAKKGVYSQKDMKNMPEEYIKKYFHFDGQNYMVKNELKACIKFKKINLLTDPYPTDCHLIICRNVMIYFTQNAKERMYKSFYDSLLPGGILFLGSTEQIINSRGYGLVPLKSFYYVKRDRDEKENRVI